MNTHEDLRRHAEIEGPSDRTFGMTFASVFLVVGLAPLRHGHPARVWALVAAAGLAIVALLRPLMLRTPNHGWMRLGLLLGRLVTPIVMFLLFYLVVTPFAWLARWRGHKFLNLGFDHEWPSYWLERRPPGPAPESMSQQF